MVNVSIPSALAIGERVGKAGPDLFRSPMKRCSHARFSRCEGHGARAARCLEKPCVETTHSESLELIANAFGYGNWNILSARIEAARPRAIEPETSAAAPQGPALPRTLYCSFCRKSQHDVRKLIAGPSVYICDECVQLCVGIVNDDEPIWKVLQLMRAAAQSGSDPDRAGLDHLRGGSAQEVNSYVVQCKGFVKHNSELLHCIQRKLAINDEVPARDDLLAAPRFAYLNEKTMDELRAMRQLAQSALESYQKALRLGDTALAERGQQTSS